MRGRVACRVLTVGVMKKILLLCTLFLLVGFSAHAPAEQFKSTGTNGFVSTLRLEDIGPWRGRTVYRLLEPLIYDSGEQVITVPAGFETDLASVPRLPIVYLEWGDRAHREAVLHDYLYSIEAVPELPREECDKLFRQAMISRGNPWWIYQPMYWGVRLGGWTGYKKLPVFYRFPEKGDKIYTGAGR